MDKHLYFLHIKKSLNLVGSHQILNNYNSQDIKWQCLTFHSYCSIFNIIYLMWISPNMRGMYEAICHICKHIQCILNTKYLSFWCHSLLGQNSLLIFMLFRNWRFYKYIYFKDNKLKSKMQIPQGKYSQAD